MSNSFGELNVEQITIVWKFGEVEAAPTNKIVMNAHAAARCPNGKHKFRGGGISKRNLDAGMDPKYVGKMCCGGEKLSGDAYVPPELGPTAAPAQRRQPAREAPGGLAARQRGVARRRKPA